MTAIRIGCLIAGVLLAVFAIAIFIGAMAAYG
jgi:hypothetical protein